MLKCSDNVKRVAIFHHKPSWERFSHSDDHVIDLALIRQLFSNDKRSITSHLLFRLFMYMPAMQATAAARDLEEDRGKG
jgi:hypothetical protein